LNVPHATGSNVVRSVMTLIVLALAPLWFVGILGRTLWTPDEPREADIAWRMSVQSDRTLPELAGTPFLEKPPLSYWMSAVGVRLFGDTPSAARAPNLLYAPLAALAIGALVLGMRAEMMAAVIAALVAASALLMFRVSIWLAPDAALLAGSALALWGVWRGYAAPPGAQKALGYTLMHAGAALGFMAKSAPGWLVPALTLATLIVWERRWSELRRWELYVGFPLEALIIVPWIWAVAESPTGGESLRALFWHNLMGRFTHIAAPPALEYTSGHRNSPGKYLLELPVYLLPWTLVVAAALRLTWTRARAADASATAWRFGVAASVPFLVLLSVAATARDIYAAPALFGFAVLTGLWVAAAEHSPSELDRLAVRLTAALVLVIAQLLAFALAILAIAGAGSRGACLTAALGALLVAMPAFWVAMQSERHGSLARSLAWSYSGYAAALTLAALAAFPIVDRWQDLPALARSIRADCAQKPLALLDPDETTIAMLDHGSRTPFTILAGGADAAQSVSEWFSARGDEARILVLLPGHAIGPLTLLLSRLRPLPPLSDGIAARLGAEGVATLLARYELSQGRRYALLGPPPKP